MEEKTYFDWLTEETEAEKEAWAKIIAEDNAFEETPEYKAHKKRLEALYEEQRKARDAKMEEAKKHRPQRRRIKPLEGVELEAWKAKNKAEHDAKIAAMPQHLQNAINGYNGLTNEEKLAFDKECWRFDYGKCADAKNTQTTEKEISELQYILVQTVIDFINERGLKDIEEVAFGADSLQSSAKYGEWTPSTDSSITVYGYEQEKSSGRFQRRSGYILHRNVSGQGKRLRSPRGMR